MYYYLVFRKFKLLILIFVFGLLSLLGCQEDPAGIVVPEQIQQGSWVTYSPYKWTHDGKPYYSLNCIVYSDGASYEMKREVGLFADEKFMEIIDLFNFQDMDDLRYPPDYDKVDVYINRYHEENIAAAYWGSIFITMRTSDVLKLFYDLRYGIPFPAAFHSNFSVDLVTLESEYYDCMRTYLTDAN